MSPQMPDHFFQAWEQESKLTLKLLRSLPSTQYDFRPDPGGRSLGELAWHLAELEAYMTHAVEQGKMDASTKIPGIERPREVEALATGYERVHAECLDRLRKLDARAFDRDVAFMGRNLKPDVVLWNALLHHLIHHRGQLHLMCRLAGGTPPGVYGPTREDWAAMKTKTGA